MFIIHDTKPIEDQLAVFATTGFGAQQQCPEGKAILPPESNPFANERIHKLAKIYHQNPDPATKAKALRTIKAEHGGNFGDGWTVEFDAVAQLYAGSNSSI